MSQESLEIDDKRLPAIVSYLMCGYLPEARDPADHDRWAKVLAVLRPEATQWPDK